MLHTTPTFPEYVFYQSAKHRRNSLVSEISASDAPQIVFLQTSFMRSHLLLYRRRLVLMIVQNVLGFIEQSCME